MPNTTLTEKTNQQLIEEYISFDVSTDDGTKKQNGKKNQDKVFEEILWRISNESQYNTITKDINEVYVNIEHKVQNLRKKKEEQSKAIEAIKDSEYLFGVYQKHSLGHFDREYAFDEYLQRYFLNSQASLKRTEIELDDYEKKQYQAIQNLINRLTKTYESNYLTMVYPAKKQFQHIIKDIYKNESLEDNIRRINSLPASKEIIEEIKNNSGKMSSTAGYPKKIQLLVRQIEAVYREITKLNHNDQTCGFLTMSKDPRKCSEMELFFALKGSDGIVLFGDKLFYINQEISEISEITSTDDNKDAYNTLKGKYKVPHELVSSNMEELALINTVIGKSAAIIKKYETADQIKANHDFTYYRDRIIEARNILTEERKIDGEITTDLDIILKDDSPITRFFKDALYTVIVNLRILFNLKTPEMEASKKDRNHYKFWKSQTYDLENSVKTVADNLKIGM